MVFSFARISAVLGMKVEDYYPNGKRWWLRLHEKGGKFHEVPAHHTAEAYLDAYLEAAGIAGDKKGPLFRSVRGKNGVLTSEPLRRDNALATVKRRAVAAGLSERICLSVTVSEDTTFSVRRAPVVTPRWHTLVASNALSQR